MIYLNKKIIHEYVDDWFNLEPQWENKTDWENDVFMKIAQFYYENECEFKNWKDSHKNKLFSLIKNDPLYVKNYKHWLEQTALNEIKKDF